MNLYVHEIFVKVTGEALVLYSLSDLHLGSPNFDYELFKDAVAEILANPLARVILPGDVTNLLRGSKRLAKKIIFAASEDELEELDDELKAYLDNKIIPILKPIADRIIGVIDGDHWDFFSDGTTSTQYICKVLDIPYLGEREAGVGIKINYKNQKSIMYRAHMRHGLGGAGGTLGGDSNKLVKQSFGFRGFHVYFGGHTHKKNIVEWLEEFPSSHFTKMLEMKVFAIRSSSFLKNPKYARSAEYKKLSTGWGQVNVRIKLGKDKNLEFGRISATIV